jgi:hypothetical protein
VGSGVRKEKKNQEPAQSGRKKRLKIHEVTAENDIRYLGPLNYQHFQILGWLCIVMTQAMLLISLGGKIDSSIQKRFEGAIPVLQWISSMSLPFLLIANFARIVNNVEGYRKQLIKNGAAMAGISLAAILVLERYAVGSLAILEGEGGQAEAVLLAVLKMTKAGRYGFVSFNIFVDLFLCTLVMFFLNYEPKHIFKGPKIRIIFRLFTVFPIAYEVVSIILKIRCANGQITLPVWVFPLLTVKPPMTFVLFIVLAVYVKTRERRFRRHGKTHEEYQAFLKTRRNSRNFSVFLAVMLAVISIVDFVILVGMSVWQTAVSYDRDIQVQVEEQIRAAGDGEDVPGLEAAAPEGPAAEAAPAEATAAETAVSEPDSGTAVQGTAEGDPAANGPDEEQLEAYAMESLNAMIAVGFGESAHLVLLAPLVLLFSYTRIPRNPRLSMFIPIVAIGLIVLLFMEGAYQGIGKLMRDHSEELKQFLNNTP